MFGRKKALTEVRAQVITLERKVEDLKTALTKQRQAQCEHSDIWYEYVPRDLLTPAGYNKICQNCKAHRGWVSVREVITKAEGATTIRTDFNAEPPPDPSKVRTLAEAAEVSGLVVEVRHESGKPVPHLVIPHDVLSGRWRELALCCAILGCSLEDLNKLLEKKDG